MATKASTRNCTKYKSNMHLIFKLFLSVRLIMTVNFVAIHGSGMRINCVHYPFSNIGENYMLPCDSLRVDEYTNCWVRNQEHPDGTDLGVHIKGMEITDGTDVLSCEAAEGGWNLLGKGCGEAKITITYDPVEGDANPAEYVRDIIVTEDIYELNWSYPEGTDQMLYSSEMVIDDITPVTSQQKVKY